MKALGFALLAAGLALIGWAFVMSVAVESPAAVIDGFPDGLVANADLMNQRLLFGVIGAGLFISGWLALILDRLSAPERKAAAERILSEQY
ncbi:hypothetical protein [Phenylobacterium sp.]|uniref:hypothetical protein n=1 Tax=Phenylobacterium sp. TaxID=1871053 RepID=UPI00393CD08D